MWPGQVGLQHVHAIVDGLQGIGYDHIVPLLAPESGCSILVSKVRVEFVQVDCHADGRIELILSRGDEPTVTAIEPTIEGITAGVNAIREFLEAEAGP